VVQSGCCERDQKSGHNYCDQYIIQQEGALCFQSTDFLSPDAKFVPAGNPVTNK